MKVLHINRIDGTLEAGADARFLHESLSFYGISSFLVTKQSQSGMPANYSFEARRLKDIVKESIYKECDLVHLHDIRHYLSIEDLRLLKDKPVIWSVTDSFPYTAGCVFSAHCASWKTGCKDCFLFGDAESKKKQAVLFELKMKALQDLNITYTCTNSWQMEQLKASLIPDKRLRQMPLLHDIRHMYSGNRKQARLSLGLPLSGIILVYHNELGGNMKKIAAYFLEVMAAFKDDVTPILVINAGDGDSMEDTGAYTVRNVGKIDAHMLGAYYRAANVNIYLSPEDIVYRPVMEAALCGLPSIVFNVGSAGEVVEDQKTGYLIPSFDKKALYQALSHFVMRPQDGVELGVAAFQKYERLMDNKGAVADYIRLYHEVLNKKIPSQPLKKDQPLLRTADLKADVQKAVKGGLTAAESFLQEQLKEYDDRPKAEKRTYVSMFCRQYLKDFDIKNRGAELWGLISLWVRFHGTEDRFEERQRVAFLEWVRDLRKSLEFYLIHTDKETFSSDSTPHVNEVVSFWRFVFLNVQSPIHLIAENYQCPQEFFQYQNASGYPFVMLKSMYTPYLDDNGRANVSVLISSVTIPLVMRFCMMFWLTSAPLYNGTKWQRKNILSYIREISKYMAEDHGRYSVSLKRVLAEHCVVSLWRLSYLGGNNIDTLRVFGKFVQKTAELLAPQYANLELKKTTNRKKKLRIGYISLNFRNQAVSQYMANRLQHADHSRFFIKTFILNYHSDAMTEKIKSYSDEYVVIDQFKQIDKVAEAICASDLDVLIYADIGMDIITYLLGSLRLVPVQAVLVGHGTTTGLENIDYYISGDHEPLDAQSHYTEKLIKLPRCGAAQLPPQKSGARFSRPQIGVPEHAIVFISCANGLKHGPERDVVLVEILRRIPNAYIVLKPFMNQGSIDRKFSVRLMEVAKKAGVENRLKILDPLPSPGDLEGLYHLADIQLDTYPYGGWTTNLEALYYHLPIITQEGDMARNRWGGGLLRAMEIEEGIAQNEEEYILWAQKLAEDQELRKNVAKKISERVQADLFNGEAAQQRYERTLLEIAKRKK